MARFPFMLCADDYALSAGVSGGILEALAAGRLSATSAMTNQPGWPAAARDLTAFFGKADLGLHLTLTLGAPLSRAPRLAPTGAFQPIGALARAAFIGQIDRLELRAEIARQIDAYCDALGRKPDFVDGHQHAHVLPIVRGALLDELAERGWSATTWLRDSGDAWARILARRVETAKALIVAAMSLGLRQNAVKRGLATNDGFAGFSSFASNGDYAADFARYLKAPGSRHLIMCHPGRVDEALRELDPAIVSREAELTFLLSPEFIETLDEADAELARWPL